MTQSLPDSKLLEVLESQGYRELVSAHLFAGGVRVAPTIDDKHMLAEHAREELSHFEVVAALYEQVAGRNLYEVVAPRAEAMPVPSSWLETTVAAYLVDRAAAVQLAAYQKLGDARLEGLIHKILDHEHEHQAAAETALLDQCRATAERASLARRHVESWYPVAQSVMDAAGSNTAAFADSVRPILSACGLGIPGDPAA
jgi:1,2-phenylacetyl-CoA epoxidase catalytic subunit